jgi:hypothetical protein
LCRAAKAKVGQIEAQFFQPDPKGLYQTVGKHKKNRGPNFARFTL